MTTEFILPDVGEGIVECEIIEWLVKEGDQIVEDRPVADVQTDKALIQIPSKYNGTVRKLHYQQGEVAKVHAPLFAIDVEGESAPAPATPDVAPTATADAIVQNPVQNAGQIVEFDLPDIGEGIVECELVEWLVKEGEQIEEDQPVADVQTDKALVQIPSMHKGTVHRLHYQPGEIAKVHKPLFSIETEVAQGSPVSAAPAPAQAAQSSGAPVQSAGLNLVQETEEEKRRVRVPASPAVRRLVREHGLDILQIPGSGKAGRVHKEDVLNFISNPVGSKPVEAVAVTSVATQPSSRTEKISGIKAAMARQMTASVQTIPHFTYAEEIDITELVLLRKRLKPELESQGIKLTMMPFFIKAMSLALLDFEILNAHVNDEGNEITYFTDHNVGMAVDTPKGLFVPNIKSVQNLSLLEVSEQVNQLAESGRAGRLGPDQLKGGTITISNIGNLGGTVTTPIINKPEVAIVGLGRMQSLPRFDDQGQVQARNIINVSWSGDHRVLDGGIIARFCNLWKSYLEHPERMLTRLR